MEHSLSPFKYRISKMQSIFIKINANLPARAQVTLAVAIGMRYSLWFFVIHVKVSLEFLNLYLNMFPQHSIVMIFLFYYENFIECNI